MKLVMFFWRMTMSRVTLHIVLFTVSLSIAPITVAQTAPTVPQEQIALSDAVIAGDVAKAMLSIKAGADVNGLDTRENVAGKNGRRPLNYAALRNDAAMITALLDAGALINLANRSGFTPLHHAAEAGSKEAAVLLIAKGANLTLRNLHNQTPIETAMASHHPEVAEVLRQATKTSK
jgi:ankyrin repeat protein